MTRREGAQALVESVLALPVCMVAALTIVECGVLVRDRLAVADAAARGAEARIEGRDVAAAARTALPASLRSSARIAVAADRVRVTVRSRTHVPGVPAVTLGSEAVTDAEAAR